MECCELALIVSEEPVRLPSSVNVRCSEEDMGGREDAVATEKDGGGGEPCPVAAADDPAPSKSGFESSSSIIGAEGGTPCGTSRCDELSSPGGREGRRRASARRSLSFSDKPTSLSG